MTGNKLNDPELMEVAVASVPTLRALIKRENQIKAAMASGPLFKSGLSSKAFSIHREHNNTPRHESLE